MMTVDQVPLLCLRYKSPEESQMSFCQALSSVPEAGREGADYPVTEPYKRPCSQGVSLMTTWELGSGRGAGGIHQWHMKPEIT